MCDNPKLDFVNINAYIEFGEILSICSQEIEWKLNSRVNQGPLFWYKCVNNDVPQSQLRSCHMNEYIKFGDILSICSQDIERNFFLRRSRAITLVQMCKIMAGNKFKLVSMHIQNLMKFCPLVLKILSGNEIMMKLGIDRKPKSSIALTFSKRDYK